MLRVLGLLSLLLVACATTDSTDTLDLSSEQLRSSSGMSSASSPPVIQEQDQARWDSTQSVDDLLSLIEQKRWPYQIHFINVEEPPRLMTNQSLPAPMNMTIEGKGIPLIVIVSHRDAARWNITLEGDTNTLVKLIAFTSETIGCSGRVCSTLVTIPPPEAANYNNGPMFFEDTLANLIPIASYFHQLPHRMQLMERVDQVVVSDTVQPFSWNREITSRKKLKLLSLIDSLEADIAFAGVYEPSDTSSKLVVLHLPQSARPMVVYLNSYEAVHWQLIPPSQGNILKVLISDYDSLSTVSGIDESLVASLSRQWIQYYGGNVDTDSLTKDYFGTPALWTVGSYDPDTLRFSQP